MQKRLGEEGISKASGSFSSPQIIPFYLFYKLEFMHDLLLFLLCLLPLPCTDRRVLETTTPCLYPCTQTHAHILPSDHSTYTNFQERNWGNNVFYRAYQFLCILYTYFSINICIVSNHIKPIIKALIPRVLSWSS